MSLAKMFTYRVSGSNGCCTEYEYEYIAHLES